MGQRQSRKGSKEARCYKYGETGHFKQECPLWKKCKGGERNDSNFISSVAESEEWDELLLVLEESARCRGFEMASEGSTECRGSEGVATMIEVQ